MIEPARLRPPLTREMAAGDRAIWTFADADLGEIEHPSVILRTRSKYGQGLGELYDEMAVKDPDLRGLQRKLEDSVLALEWTVVPADDDQRSRQAADLCHFATGRVADWQGVLRHQIEATARGIAFGELIWAEETRGSWAGAWLPAEIVSQPMRRFGFKGPRRKGARPRLFVRPSDALAKDFFPPPAKIWAHRQGGNDSPWGDPLWDSCYWSYYLKMHGLEFWSLAVERWSAPTTAAKWKRRPGDDEQIRKENDEMEAAALALAQSVWGGSAISIPDDVIVELIEATRSGNMSFADFCQAQTRKQALVIQGEIQTSGLRPSVGAYAAERVSQEIRAEKRDLVARALEAQVRLLFRWITDLNFGPDVPEPLFLIDTLDDEDREVLMAGIDRAFSANLHLPDPLPIPLSHLRRVWRIPRPVGAEPVVTTGFESSGGGAEK